MAVSLMAWSTLCAPAILATLPHYQRPYTPNLWSHICDAMDPGDWPRTREVEAVICPRCLYHGNRRRYQARRWESTGI
jgi:hypothetical protein